MMILGYVAYSLLSFAIGLYVGGFVQRRRDMKIIKPLQKVINRLLENKKIKKEEK